MHVIKWTPRGEEEVTVIAPLQSHVFYASSWLSRDANGFVDLKNSPFSTALMTLPQPELRRFP